LNRHAATAAAESNRVIVQTGLIKTDPTATTNRVTMETDQMETNQYEESSADKRRRRKRELDKLRRAIETDEERDAMLVHTTSYHIMLYVCDCGYCDRLR